MLLKIRHRIFAEHRKEIEDIRTRYRSIANRPVYNPQRSGYPERKRPGDQQQIDVLSIYARVLIAVVIGLFLLIAAALACILPLRMLFYF